MEKYSRQEGLRWMAPPTAEGSFTNFQIRKPASNPGMPATKNADRQPQRAATCVVSTGAAARPTSAAALTTNPMFRPRRLTDEDSSIRAVMMDHVGPSATPIRARINSSWWKLCAKPDIQDNIENTKTAGTSTGLRPRRSDKAPKKNVDAAQVIARTEARVPICALPRWNSGAK